MRRSSGKDEFALENQRPSWEACIVTTLGSQGDLTEAITREQFDHGVRLTDRAFQTRKPSAECPRV